MSEAKDTEFDWSAFHRWLKANGLAEQWRNEKTPKPIIKEICARYSAVLGMPWVNPEERL